MGFLSGDASTNATDSAPAEILCVGYGCFILVVIAPYTANLAAFLTVAVQSSSYTSGMSLTPSQKAPPYIVTTLSSFHSKKTISWWKMSRVCRSYPWHDVDAGKLECQCVIASPHIEVDNDANSWRKL